MFMRLSTVWEIMIIVPNFMIFFVGWELFCYLGSFNGIFYTRVGYIFIEENIDFQIDFMIFWQIIGFVLIQLY